MAAGAAGGVMALILLIAALGPVLADMYGIFIYLSPPDSGEWLLLGCVCLAGLLASLVPALRAYRMSLSDGLTVAI